MQELKCKSLIHAFLLIFMIFVLGGCPTKNKPGKQEREYSVDQKVLDDQNQLLQKARDSMEVVKP